MQTLRVDVWSDIACPWCYVGKRRLEAALSTFEHRDAVRVTWRAFELDPSAPPVRPTDVSYAERLGRKYGTSTAEAQGMIQRMTDVAAEDGLDFRFDHIRPGNTFDAHRLLHLAGHTDPSGRLQDAVKERFLLGYMTEGAAIGETSTLVRLAAEAGLDEAEVIDALAGDAFSADVRADEAEAAARGISGVPFFVFGSRYAVSGAQPSALLLSAMRRTWSEATPIEVLAEGAACGPAGCD